MGPGGPKIHLPTTPRCCTNGWDNGKNLRRLVWGDPPKKVLACSSQNLPKLQMIQVLVVILPTFSLSYWSSPGRLKQTLTGHPLPVRGSPTSAPLANDRLPSTYSTPPVWQFDGALANPNLAADQRGRSFVDLACGQNEWTIHFEIASTVLVAPGADIEQEQVVVSLKGRIRKYSYARFHRNFLISPMLKVQKFAKSMLLLTENLQQQLNHLRCTSCFFNPFEKIWVKFDHFPGEPGENQNKLETTTLEMCSSRNPPKRFIAIRLRKWRHLNFACVNDPFLCPEEIQDHFVGDPTDNKMLFLYRQVFTGNKIQGKKK